MSTQVPIAAREPAALDEEHARPGAEVEQAATFPGPTVEPMRAPDWVKPTDPMLFALEQPPLANHQATPEALPPSPREIPFKFNNLRSASAVAFCRAYRKSEDPADILSKGRTFASDQVAVDEVQNLGPNSATFLAETMLKLGIPLS